MKKKKHFLSNQEIAAFCDQLFMVMSAGIPIYEGVSILLDDASDEETKLVLSSINAPLENGSSFHEALVQSGYFPKYVLDMVEIGELSGRLDEVLSSLSRYYEREESIRSGIKHAVTYPLLMIAMMFAVLIVLIVKVLPVFNQIYIELGSEMTGFSAVMMKISVLINRYILYVLIFVAVIIVGFIIFSKTNAGRKMLKKGSLSKLTAAGRFANCMYMALGSGLDTDQGLALTEQLADNPYMEAKIQRCRELTASGMSFSEAVLSAEIFEKIYSSMITIGFKTGSLDKVMQKISKEYENIIDYRISRFISLLEPAIVIILSVFIGLILISFLMPLIGIMSGIG